MTKQTEESFTGDLNNVLQILLSLIDPAYGGTLGDDPIPVKRSTIEAIERRVRHALVVAPKETDAAKLEWIRNNSERFYKNSLGWWMRPLKYDAVEQEFSISYNTYTVIGPYSSLDDLISATRLADATEAFYEYLDKLEKYDPQAFREFIEEIRLRRLQEK